MMIGIICRQDGGTRGGDEFAQRRARLLDPDRAEEVRIDHQADADHHARYDAGKEKSADRDVAGGAINDRHDARRDQVRDGRGAGDQRCGESAVIALFAHLRRHGTAQHRDVGGRRTGNAGKEHAENGDDLRQPAAQMADHGLRQPDHPIGDIRRGHQFADQEEKRHRQQDFGVDAVEHLPDHRLHADRGEHAGGEHAGHQCEGDGYAHITEGDKQEGHQQQDRTVTHFTIPAKSSASSGPSKPLRQPLISCSMVNTTISTPATGTLAV